MITIKIKVTTEDFRNATSYTDSSSCPLAVAIKRQLGVYKVSVAAGTVSIKNMKGEGWERYDVDYSWCSAQRIYKGEYEGMSIDEMIELAKSNPDIEFPEVELELVAGEF
jgi:hypothetical protein